MAQLVKKDASDEDISKGRYRQVATVLGSLHADCVNLDACATSADFWKVRRKNLIISLSFEALSFTGRQAV
jgi:hypothetical protein